MQRGHRVLNWIRHPVAWLVAMVVGASFGLLEGAIYSPPNFWIYAYWTLLALLMTLAMAGQIGWLRAFALLPVAVVTQDAVSLFTQGDSPWTATWYSAYFGDNVLTRSNHGLPNWYFIAPVLAVVLDAGLHTIRRCRLTAMRTLGGRRRIAT